MVAKDFKIGDLVWAKMKGYPFWPAKIKNPPGGTSARKAQHYVYFFGSKNHAWIMDDCIVPHPEGKDLAGTKKKTAALQKAIEEIEKVFRGEATSSDAEDQPETPKKSSPTTSLEPKVTKPSKATDEKKKEKTPKTVKKVPVPKKRLQDSLSFSSPSKRVKNEKDVDDDYSNLFSNVPPNNNDSSFLHSPIKRSENEVSLLPSTSFLTRVEEYIPPPPSPSIEVSKVSESWQKKIGAMTVKATEKKIGFLGLGMMGGGIVKNLINSGHKVTVWNRTPEKCEKFAKAGVKVMQTPCDVVQNSDITFCCVSDPDAVKTVVLGNWGVLKGLEGAGHGTKGYVEMSSIDPVTSQEIAEAITDKGGRYLEAPINGNMHMAEEGTLLILGAGDRELFNDCESCFFAISKNAYYLSCTVGEGSKMNLITNMLLGTTYAALAEAISLVQRCELSTTNFLEILGLGPFNSTIVVEKGHSMVNKDFTINTALKHQQKDLYLALSIGNACEQPMFVTSAANEIYKNARRRRYADHDVSAVLFGYDQ